MPLDEALKSVLVCPACRGPLAYETAPEALVCPACHLRYRIEDDIPVMLVDEAERIG